jgi:hypothetical protein
VQEVKVLYGLRVRGSVGWVALDYGPFLPKDQLHSQCRLSVRLPTSYPGSRPTEKSRLIMVRDIIPPFICPSCYYMRGDVRVNAESRRCVHLPKARQYVTQGELLM